MKRRPICYFQLENLETSSENKFWVQTEHSLDLNIAPAQLFLAFGRRKTAETACLSVCFIDESWNPCRFSATFICAFWKWEFYRKFRLLWILWISLVKVQIAIRKPDLWPDVNTHGPLILQYVTRIPVEKIPWLAETAMLNVFRLGVVSKWNSDASASPLFIEAHSRKWRKKVWSHIPKTF